MQWLASGGHWEPEKNRPSADFTTQHPRYLTLIQSELWYRPVHPYAVVYSWYIPEYTYDILQNVEVAAKATFTLGEI